jgi:hypothetical protein
MPPRLRWISLAIVAVIGCQSGADAVALTGPGPILTLGTTRFHRDQPTLLSDHRRFVAFGSVGEHEVRIWDHLSGRLVKVRTPCTVPRAAGSQGQFLFLCPEFERAVVVSAAAPRPRAHRIVGRGDDAINWERVGSQYAEYLRPGDCDSIGCEDLLRLTHSCLLDCAPQLASGWATWIDHHPGRSVIRAYSVPGGRQRSWSVSVSTAPEQARIGARLIVAVPAGPRRRRIVLLRLPT